MEDRIREHVISLFEGAPRTKRSVELMEEMVQNLTDKFNDLVDEGKTPDAAYNIVINGIGDVGELLNDLEDSEMKDDRDFEKARAKSAILTSVAVMMYMLCIIPVAIFEETVGLTLMFVMVAGATGLLIYNNMTKPRYIKNDDSMVEEFRQFRSQKSRHKETIKAVQSALWAVIVALYFLISFTTFAWHLTWIIFLVGGAVSNIVRLVMNNYE